MTANPEKAIDRLRERLDDSDDISDADATALRAMSEQINLHGSSKYGDYRHEFYLRRGVHLAEEVGGLADALEDRDAAERLVRWINTEQTDSDETNKDYRVTLRQFGKLVAEDYDDIPTNEEDIPDSLAWISGGYPENFDPAPDPGDMLRWDEDIIPMVDECHNLRDRALITLAWDLGPRPHELFNLTLGQFTDAKHGMRVTLDGKTGRRSPIIVRVSYVKKWLEVHPGEGDADAPFLSRKNSTKQISNNRVRDILKEKARKAGVDRPVTPTNFRKSSASYLASQGVSQAHLEDHHGWTRGSGTATRYISVLNDANDREIANAHGVDVEEESPTPAGPVTCDRCERKTPREQDFCVWCHHARSQTAVEGVEAQQDRMVTSAHDAEDDLAEDVIELQNLLRERPALRAALLGEG
jgi:integrase